jgi:6-phosphogluconolactonase (cycloisomerase 2 family)
VVNELANTVSVYRLSPTGAELTSSVSVLPEGSSGHGMFASAILLSADNRFIYITNRMENHPEGDAIVWLEISKDGDKLSKKSEVRTGLDHPRGAQLSEDGRYLITGSKTQKGAVLYERNAQHGSLKEVARNEDVIAAACFVDISAHPL